MKRHPALFGFSLIELLVVMAIIAILATVSLASYEGTRRSSRDGRRKADLEMIRGSLEQYRADNRQYPAAYPACGGSFTYGSSTYLNKIPCDPKVETASYGYSAPADGSSYTVGAILEGTDTSGGDACSGLMCAIQGGGTAACNYCLINP